MESTRADLTTSIALARLASPARDRVGNVGAPFNGVKVSTALADRDRLGDVVTTWIKAHRDYAIRDLVVTQSNDSACYCLSIAVFYSIQVSRVDPRAEREMR
jgi:hypothetical protein